MLLNEIGNDIIEVKAKDSRRYSQTGTGLVLVNPDILLSSTRNLITKLKLCDGAKVMITDNINVTDRLVNGSCERVVYLFFKRKSLLSVIFAKVDDLLNGNFMKKYGCELTEYVPIIFVTEVFSYSYNNRRKVNVERNQYPLVVALAV